MNEDHKMFQLIAIPSFREIEHIIDELQIHFKKLSNLLYEIYSLSKLYKWKIC